MRVVKVKHQHTSTEFLFKTDFDLKKGQEVAVDTRYGTQMATCSCNSFLVDSDALKDLASVSNYHWPLRSVIGVFVGVNEKRQEQAWVPTEDYLPECGRKCIVTTEAGEVGVSEVILWNGEYRWMHPAVNVPINVKAWMYMPKAFKEAEVEEDEPVY